MLKRCGWPTMGRTICGRGFEQDHPVTCRSTARSSLLVPSAARNQDRDTTRIFLAEADQMACRLGHDSNHVWTAFGPTNVAIHRVSTAMELGDVHVAIDLGSKVDASPLPLERQIRHALELVRAYGAWNRREEALAVLLDAESRAPEQVRHHQISRQVVLGWVRQQRGRPPHQLTDLARRLQVV
jgi:hypothetical protein